jgi:hypothetical protein
MWSWLKKVIGTYEKPLVLTKEIKRARTKRGRYKGDDKSTPDVNEAWVGGKAPKKKKRRVYKIGNKRYVIKKKLRTNKKKYT